VNLGVVQAPVFHSHGFAVFLKLKEPATSVQIAEALGNAANGVVVHAEDGLSPSPVTVVGSDVVHVARVATDATLPGSCFLWAVSDNLRIAASNALQVAESLMLAPATPR
jgi:aspartate-semialdehyde dehydrogenase